jgi:hypothetical protein
MLFKVAFILAIISAICFLSWAVPYEVTYGKGVVIDKQFSAGAQYGGAAINTKGGVSFGTMSKSDDYFIIFKTQEGRILKTSVSMEHFYKFNIGDPVRYSDHWYGISINYSEDKTSITPKA